MVEQGADLIDVGGESTRPGAAPLPVDEELQRVLPVLEGLRGRHDVPLSIDTYKAEVADRALDLGADDRQRHQRTDVRSGACRRGRKTRAAVVLMHHRGRSDDMYARRSMTTWRKTWRASCPRAPTRAGRGILADRIILDPDWASRSERSTRLRRSRAAAPGGAGYPILAGRRRSPI
jgi:dihydropteroate synthase